MVSVPVVKTLLFALYFLVFKRREPPKLIISKIICSFMSLYLIEQPGAVQRLFSYFVCVPHSENIWISTTTGTQCYTQEWADIAWRYVIPALAVWIVGLTIFSLLPTLLQKWYIENEYSTMCFKIFYIGFKETRLWWQTAVMIFKISIAALITFLSTTQNIFALACFAALYLYYSLLVCFKPYLIKEVYVMEKRLYRSYMMIVIATAFYIYERDDPVFQTLSLIVILATNFYALGVLLFKFLRSKSDKERKMQKYLSETNNSAVQLDNQGSGEEFTKEEQEIVRKGRSTMHAREVARARIQTNLELPVTRMRKSTDISTTI